MKLNWNFPGGCGGAKQKTFRGGSMDIFWNYTLPGIHLAFFQTRPPGKYVRKDTCPDKILVARSKLCNNLDAVNNK